MKKVGSIVIYIVGICMVIYFLACALLGGNTVANPDAMIPFTEFERNIIILGIGFIPMALRCVFLIRAFDIKARIKRILIFIPAVITGIPFVCGVVMIVIMLVLGIKDAIVG